MKFYQLKLFVIVVFMMPFVAISQDVHFSQFDNSPLFINPATTGNFDGNFRLGFIYRNQGRSISVPYKTYSAFADSKISFPFLKRTWFGVGFMAYNDNAGDGILQNSLGSISISVTQGFSRFNAFRASMGFTTGFVNRSVNFTQLVFDDQWNGLQFDPNQSSNEPFTSNSVFAFDFNFGVLLVYDISYSLHASVGTSLSHINRPKTTFYKEGNRIDRKLIVHGNLQYDLNENLSISPSAFYSLQDNTFELVFGSRILYGKNDFKLDAGLWYRWQRDIIPMVGLLYHNYNFTISYDVNSSKMSTASNYFGGVEVSLIKILHKRYIDKPCSDFN